jgi:hypothetical protein
MLSRAHTIYFGLGVACKRMVFVWFTFVYEVLRGFHSVEVSEVCGEVWFWLSWLSAVSV